MKNDPDNKLNINLIIYPLKPILRLLQAIRLDYCYNYGAII